MIELRLWVQVASVVELRGLEVDIVYLAANGTRATPRHALFKHFKRNVNGDGQNLFALLIRQLFKHLGLHGCARETVKDVTVFAILAAGALTDHANHQSVRDELPGTHDCFDFVSERRPLFLHDAQYIARRNLEDILTLLQKTRLSSLTC